MEPVVHRRGNAYGQKNTVRPGRSPPFFAQQIFQGIWETFRLKHLAVHHLPTGSNDAVARADHRLRVGVHGASTIFEFAHKAIVQAVKALLA